MDFQIAFWNWSFGNAVLSKFPIKNADLVKLPGHSIVETYLLGQKQAVACEVDHPFGAIQIIGTHLSQRSEQVRVSSARIAIDRAKQSPIATVFVGDLNSSPSGFKQSVRDASGENAIDLLDRSQEFHRWSQINDSNLDQCTFHSSDPTMVIDWIFVPRSWKFLKYQVHSNQLSDHRLIHAELRLQ